jgi:hypothetical protein
MYVNKPQYQDVFVLPDRDATIWRYMEFWKLVSLLEEQALFFPRSDLFDDRFEGSYPKGAAIESDLEQMVATAAIDQKLPKKLIRERAQGAIGWRKQIRESVLISCWHVNESESAAMWKLYVQSNKGIAVKSTVRRLLGSIRCPEDVYVGAVQYRNYDKDQFPSMNIFHPFMSKRKSFEHERELRALIWDQERFGGLSGSFPIQKRDNGTHAATDLDLLIAEICVSPDAPDELLQATVSVCKRYGLRSKVIRSRLDDFPLY